MPLTQFAPVLVKPICTDDYQCATGFYDRVRILDKFVACSSPVPSKRRLHPAFVLCRWLRYPTVRFASVAKPHKIPEPLNRRLEVPMSIDTSTENKRHLDIRNLKPQKLWNHFVNLNSVPRPSKQEERVIDFARQFGKRLGLSTHVDSVGNVIIRKPATSGMENKRPVVMQSHLDMVCQKNADVEFDFDRQGIEMEISGDWVRAQGTTLGADNGIGVAAIMAVLESTDIEHPPLEALFTIDEETGMTGAQGLHAGSLNGKILLNLDTEDDDELTIGCAGGVDIIATNKYLPEETPAGSSAMRVAVTGLSGGHSGMQIHEGLGNANKIMNRILWKAAAEFEIHIVEIDGGGLQNAIPRESFATIVVNSDQADEFRAWMDSQSDIILSEYRVTDPELTIV